jgi:hypothetical protein
MKRIHKKVPLKILCILENTERKISNKNIYYYCNKKTTTWIPLYMKHRIIFPQMPTGNRDSVQNIDTLDTSLVVLTVFSAHSGRHAYVAQVDADR